MTALDRGEHVSVDGIGSLETVDCERFSVDGTCTVNGDVHADHVDLDGATSVAGGLDARHLDSDGPLSVGGDLHVDVVSLDGATEVGGNVDAHEVDADGAVQVGGSVIAAEATFDGALSVGGLTDVTTLDLDGAGEFTDVNAETFTVDGALDAHDVSAATFHFVVHSDSTVESVRGTEIHVRRGERGSSLLDRFVDDDDARLTVETVEGESVDLDATEAETVVGERVRLGSDCDVGVVYSDDLDADSGARVGEVRSYDAY